MPAKPSSWKLTLPCTRAEAAALQGDIVALAALEPPPVLTTSEADPGRPDAWRLDAYFEGKPDRQAEALLRALVPSAGDTPALIERLPDEDWVTISQQGLEPVIAGRFFLHADPAETVPAGHVPLLIPAGRAFGTGQHETTAGCLHMLDRLRRVGARFGNICDVGTGTGVLTFAAMHLWPRAFATASDIDPVSIEVTSENAALNGVALGGGRGALALFTAPGVSHDAIAGRGPYDLIVANILAGPLIALAPSIAALLEDGGTLILAGLLDTQSDAVIAAYRRQGLRLAERIDIGQWPALRLRKRPAIGWRRPGRWKADDVGETPGFGSW
jgi:ribosomal protein L11 methyltransferase